MFRFPWLASGSRFVKLNRVRRVLLVGFLATAFCGLALPVRSAMAQTGNWEYVPELGGYLDWDTGLVWGEHSITVSGWGSWSWDGAQDIYLPSYRTLTGIQNWRMPTVAELQSAAAHGINAVINNPYPRGSCWTSDTKSKGWSKFAHYQVSPTTGSAGLYDNRASGQFIPVYRAFTP